MWSVIPDVFMAAHMATVRSASKWPDSGYGDWPIKGEQGKNVQSGFQEVFLPGWLPPWCPRLPGAGVSRFSRWYNCCQFYFEHLFPGCSTGSGSDHSLVVPQFAALGLPISSLFSGENCHGSIVFWSGFPSRLGEPRHPRGPMAATQARQVMRLAGGHGRWRSREGECCRDALFSAW